MYLTLVLLSILVFTKQKYLVNSFKIPAHLMIVKSLE